MSSYIKSQEWLSVVRKEYLHDFIRNGGAAVKFVIPGEGVEQAGIRAGLQQIVKEEGFLFAFVDAATTKIHLIDQLFFEVAKQVDWPGFAHTFLRRSLEAHYKLPETRQDFNLKTISDLNGYEERDMRPLINKRLRDSLFRDYSMTQEFRIAMLRLCRAQLDPAEVNPELCNSIVEWLQGKLHLISALKPALIFRKIGRHNARHLLLSLAHWLQVAGMGGLVLVLDISRYTQEKPKEPDGANYYSKSAALDCYEVLRQFIDGTDESEFLFTVALAPPQFLDPDCRRGVYEYDALKLRIWDEVYDRFRANPLSSLVRLSSCPTTLVERGGENGA